MINKVCVFIPATLSLSILFTLCFMKIDATMITYPTFCYCSVIVEKIKLQYSAAAHKIIQGKYTGLAIISYVQMPHKPNTRY